MSYLDWHVGMKVAFRDTGHVNLIRKGWRKWLPKVRLTHNLVVGEVYTVSGLTIHNDSDVVDVVCVFLSGFAFIGYPNVGFPAVWFEPVQTRTIDISIFEHLLNPTEDETFRELEAEQFDYEHVEVPFR